MRPINAFWLTGVAMGIAIGGVVTGALLLAGVASWWLPGLLFVFASGIAGGAVLEQRRGRSA